MAMRNPLKKKRMVKIRINNPNGLPPEKLKELEEQAQEVIMNGRPTGQFFNYIRQQLLNNGRTAPMVLADEKLGTMMVPAEFEGLMALMSSFDSLLLPEELHAVREAANMMVPMGLNQQTEERARREQVEAEHAHVREEHPEQWQQMQGWRV